MPQALTKAEVSDLLQVSPRTVERRAQELRGQDGAFDLSKLPPEIQREWAAKQKVVPFAPPGQLALSLTVPEGPNLSDADRVEAERRLSVIEPLIAPDKYPLLYAQHKGSKVQVVEWLAKQHQAKVRTIYTWLKLYKDGGLPALVRKDRADKGQPKSFNNAALDFILASALPRRGAYGEYSVAEIYRAYGEERAWRLAHARSKLGEFELQKYARYLDPSGRLAHTAQLPDASYRTFCHWFLRIPEIVRVMARDGEERFHNTQEILSFRALSEIKPLDYVVMDHRRLDLFCMIRDGSSWKLARPWLTAAIDMRTRKWLAWVIVEQPSSDSIAAVLKRAFLDWGLPVSVYWDNGKDFRCEWLEGGYEKSRQAEPVKEMGTAWRGVLDSLGVRVHHAIVKRARSKIIEPNFGNTSNFDRTLPWWCGHKPSARPEVFQSLVKQHEAWLKGEVASGAAQVFPTLEQVAETYNEFLRALNERDHSGEGMKKITPTGTGWMCPNECWEKLIGGVERRSVSAEVLQFAFAKRKSLTVRNGELRCTIHGRALHYRMADNSMALMALNGNEVELAYDPLDLETVAVYHRDRLLGLANDAELRRMGEDGFVQDERDRRRARREVKKFIQAVHAQVPVPNHRERAQRREGIAPERTEPGRVFTEASIPAGVAAAVAAAAVDREFSFAAAGAEIVQLPAVESADAGDDTFEFFQGGTNASTNL